VCLYVISYAVFGDLYFVCRMLDVESTSSVVPRHRLSTYGRRAFAVAGPTAWNLFPDNFLDPDLTTDNFKRLLKTFLFSAYECN